MVNKEKRLNAVWNSTLPVNSLPNELIVYIFILHTESHGSNEPDPRWSRILAVCRHWYTVACATPQLWRYIRVPGRREWVELCLVRSAQCTVDIHLANQYISAGSLDLILPHAHRIRSLYWPDTVDAWLQGPTPFLLVNRAMPSLETLRIVRRLGPEGPETASRSGILTGRYPRLRSFTSKGAAILAERGSFPNLRSLSLVSCLLQGMTFATFVDFLSRMPLQELFLYDILKRLSVGSSDRGPRRSLPRLTKLALGDHPPHASSQFLSHLTLPSLATITVSARKEDYIINFAANPHSLSALLPSDRATSLPMFSRTAYISLTVLNGYLTIASSRRYPRDPQECIDLDIPVEPLNVWLPHAFQDLLLLYAGAPVKHLSVEAFHGFDLTDPWVPVLHAFPDLEHLSLYGMGDLLDVSLALTPERNAGDHEGKSVVCPSLRSLLFEGDFDVFPDSVQALLDCLRYRAERGSRLEEFTWISEVKWNERYRQPLEELVDEVVWKDPRWSMRGVRVFESARCPFILMCCY